MLDPRRGEQNVPERVRTPRYFQTDEGWFLRTREGISVGPYSSKFDAEISSSLLCPRLAQLDDESKAVATIHAFIRDPAYGPVNEALRVQKVEESEAEKQPAAATSASARENAHYQKVRAELPKPHVKHGPLSSRLRSLLPGSLSVR
ncbi:MAG: DUF6316 family protein [Gammaproteobacteria bacterium]|nr:DUF6316 family protein [Gammaproteobacteria bacterium]